MRERRHLSVCSREKSGAIDCPGRCACIDVPGDPEPYRFISDAALLERDGGDLGARGLAWSTKVDFCARNLRLTTLATFLERAHPGEVFVPGSKLHSTVACELDGVTVAELAETAGLLVRPRE